MKLTSADLLAREKSAISESIRASHESIAYWKQKMAAAWRADEIIYASSRLLAWEMNLKTKRARLIEIGKIEKMEVPA